MSTDNATIYGTCTGIIAVDTDPASFNARAKELIEQGYGPYGQPYHCKAGVRLLFIKWNKGAAEDQHMPAAAE